jgi:predicted transcriptional regulator
MSTTPIRLEADLEARVAAAAARASKTPHAFVLEATANTVEQYEQAHAFPRVAGQRWAAILAGGGTVPWDDAKAWLEARVPGETPPRLTTR